MNNLLPTASFARSATAEAIFTCVYGSTIAGDSGSNTGSPAPVGTSHIRSEGMDPSSSAGVTSAWEAAKRVEGSTNATSPRASIASNHAGSKRVAPVASNVMRRIAGSARRRSKISPMTPARSPFITSSGARTAAMASMTATPMGHSSSRSASESLRSCPIVRVTEYRPGWSIACRSDRAGTG